MKKLKNFGKVLTRNEMKSVAGGYHQCDEDYVCGPPCPAPEDNHGEQSKGWACDSPNGACRPQLCEIT